MTRFCYLTVIWLSLSLVSNAQKINSAKLDSLFNLLDTGHKFMGSIAIAQNGIVIYNKAVGQADVASHKNADVQTKYRIGSISKMFTACLIFKAVEEKKLSLDETLDRYFPEIPNAHIITLSNLLNHRSGIYNFTNDTDYVKWNTAPKTEKEMLTIISRYKSEFEPNTKSSYSNSNYVLLSYILEQVYKKPYGEILNTKIIQPLGLKNTYCGGKIEIGQDEANSYIFTRTWEKQPETDLSIPMGAGSVVSNPTDLVHFIDALFNGKIITENSLQTMKTIQDNYGMGIFKAPYFDKTCYGHTGGIDWFTSVVYEIPEDHIAIAINSNGNSFSNNTLVIDALNCWYNHPFTLPNFNRIVLKTEDLDIYLGEYTSEDIPLNLSITKDGATLIAQASGQSEFPLDAVAKDKFEFTTAGIVMEFNPEKKQLILKQGGKEYLYSKK